VTVDAYAVPAKLNVARTLKAMRDDFLRALNAKVISSDPGTRDGYKAIFFSYERSNGLAVGNGIAVIVPRKKPRTYFVVSMHTPNATAEQIAAVDRFLASFHIK
jgi:hypothetical protein